MTIDNQFIHEHSALVNRIARQYPIPATSCLAPADLIQEGYLGLLEALRHFDPNRDVTFRSYAAWWVRKYITEALHRYRTAVSYPPSHPFSEQDFSVSLDKPVSASPSADGDEDTDATLADTIPATTCPTPEQLLIQRQDMQLLQQAFADLAPREQLILTRLYGLDDREPATAEALASALSVSQWSIHKLRERALRKLKKNALFMSNFASKPVYT